MCCVCPSLSLLFDRLCVELQNKHWKQPHTQNTITNLQGLCQTSETSSKYTFSLHFYSTKYRPLHVSSYAHSSVTTRGRKNRRRDQRHVSGGREERGFISDRSWLKAKWRLWRAAPLRAGRWKSPEVAGSPPHAGLGAINV